jgi:methionyl-tRNA formyltransferase
MSHQAPKRVALFADQDVGLQALQFVIDHHPRDLALVVATSDNDISAVARDAGCAHVLVRGTDSPGLFDALATVDVVFLAWWPTIIRENIIGAVRGPIVNFHPSLLPYNRGKHYNFWTLVEGTPFGVSLHLVDAGVDSGPILFQKPVAKSWEDTGGTLYRKAKQAMIELFKERYEDIVAGRYTPIVQDLERGTFHYARELEPASKIELDESYTARELLNRLRARTFEGKPGCRFTDEGRTYEVRVDIREIARD